MALVLGVVPLPSKDLELKKKVGKYEVAVKIDKNPPILGKNRLEIEIREIDGTFVTDAEVLVNYYMPPMPRMAPMNYKTKAKRKDEKYRAEMKLIMEGPWIIAVKIVRREEKLTARFNIDAR